MKSDVSSLTNKKRNREQFNEEEKTEFNNINKDFNIQTNSLLIKDNNNKNLLPNAFLSKKKIIFKYENQKEIIDSAFIFKDGDIIIFKNTYSQIYNTKTNKQKLILNFLGSISFFCYLNEETFISNKNSYFTIYKFLNNRSDLQQIQRINFPDNYFSRKIFHLTNGDIICQTYLHLETRLLIYTKKNNDEKYLGLKDYSPIIINVDEIIELNIDKFLTIKKTINDELIFKIYNTQDYKLVKSNTIYLRSDRTKVIYFIFTFSKINENKIINGNLNNIFIFDLQMLDLETIINFNDFKINKLKYINNETILLIGEDEECNKKNIGLENRVIFKRLKMDFCLNDIIDEKDEDMTEYIGKFISLFQIDAFWDKEIYTLVGKSILRIYST